MGGGAFYCKYVICMFKTSPVRIYVLKIIILLLLFLGVLCSGAGNVIENM